MPIIRVEMLDGRTLDQKRALARGLTEAMVVYGNAPPEAVRVVFTDVSRDDWAVAGELRSDRDAREAHEGGEAGAAEAKAAAALAVESKPVGPEGRSSAT